MIPRVRSTYATPHGGTICLPTEMGWLRKRRAPVHAVKCREEGMAALGKPCRAELTTRQGTGPEPCLTQPHCCQA